MTFTITRRPSVLIDKKIHSDGVQPEQSAPGTSTQNNLSEKAPVKVLPPAPSFDNVFLHAKGAHKASAKLPPHLLHTSLLPLLFSLFYSDSVLTQLAENTSAYAASKNAGDAGTRAWTEVATHELRVFIGIIIYMDVFGKTGVKDYWSTSSKYPQHSNREYMSLSRFEQIKRYIHIASLDGDQSWYSKLEPLSSKLAADSPRYFVPSTDVSVDGMIARFSGCSMHTVKMRCKPTPQGYKSFALCDAGYTYSFLYYSRADSFVGVTPIRGLSPTSSAVVHLARTLPHSSYRFNIYNLVSSSLTHP